MQKFSRRFYHLFLAFFFLIFGVVAHFVENSRPENTKTEISSQNQAQGIIEATQEKVAKILDDTEVQKTLERIKKDEGLYQKDWAVFMNREWHLPIQNDREYYSEWTVKTPWERDRWARRIVEGKWGELYFTDDHYQSFVRIQ